MILSDGNVRPSTDQKSSLRDLVLGSLKVHVALKRNEEMSRGGRGQVVSVLAFNSDDLSLNPADAYSFFYKICILKGTKINIKVTK